MKHPRRLGLLALGGSGWMGGAEYIRNLARAVRTADPNVELSILCRSDDQQFWKSAGSTIPIPAWPTRWTFTKRLGLGNRFLRQVVEDAGIEFVYPLTYNNEHTFGVTLPIDNSRLRARWAGWVPDFQHRYLPQYFDSGELEHRERQIKILVENAPVIVLSSEHAASDFREFYPAHAAKGRVLTFATFPQPEWAGPLEDPELDKLPRKFFAICNQFWQHKNHLVVFEALKLLRDRGLCPRVVCTGELCDYRDPSYTRTVAAVLEPLRASGQVAMLGLVSRRRQIELLRRSIAIIQPSLFEGWSTVVEDARVLGRKLVLSDLPVHREQNPPGAVFFNPHSAEELATHLSEVWEHGNPGPDLAAEAEAAERANRRIQEVGEHLLQIASGSL